MNKPHHKGLAIIEASARQSTQAAMLSVIHVTAVLVALLASPAALTQSANEEPAPPGGAGDMADIAEEVVERTNDFRRRHELPPLSVDERLQAAAADFADFLASSERFSHEADGRTPAERAAASGYDYCVVRENLARMNNVSRGNVAERTVQGWIDSDEHRANMLAQHITETGVALAVRDGRVRAVQMFGKPRSEAFEVVVTNTTGEQHTIAIQAGEAGDTLELAPRARFLREQCMPVRLSLDADGPSLEVADDANLRITTANGQPRLERVD